VKRIAANLAKDALRKQKQLTILSSDSLEEVATEEHRIDPMEALTLGVLRDELRSAIQSLPDEQRLALVMHYFGDMSLQDIAWAMRCPVGTVKSRLFYALRRVREALTKQRASE
jgi:RNA polymerase sigma-70 factor (ECF subfamily)